MISSFIRGLTAILVFLFLIAPIAMAQTPAAEQLPEPLAGWGTDLRRIELALKDNSHNDNSLLRLREELERIDEKVADYVKKIKTDYAAARSQLDNLGPAPKPEDPPESETASQIREELAKKVAELDGVIRTAGVLQTRAGQISATLQQQRRSLFSNQLFKQVKSPLSPSLWIGVANYAETGIESVRTLFSDWWYSMIEPRWLIAIFGAAAALWIGLYIVSQRLILRFRTYEGDTPAPFLRRAASAGGVIIVRTLLHIVPVSFTVAALWYFHMLSGRIEPLVMAALIDFCTVIVLWTMIRTVLSPNQPDWRVLYETDENAKRLYRLASGVAIIHGIDLFLAQLNATLDAPLPLTVAQSFLTTTLVAIFLALMVRKRIGRTGGKSETESTWDGSRKILRFIIGVCVIIAMAAAVLGYIAFSRFLMGQVVLTGSIMILLYLLHIAIEDFSTSFSKPDRHAGQWLERNFDFNPRRHIHFGLIASFFLHMLLLGVFAPLILLQWGFDWEDIRIWGAKALFGFEVGQWHISLSTIFAAFILFVLGLFATRIFQRWLDTKILQRAQFEQGARSAIRTGVGYLGFAIAALLAISYAGLDFSNLAIVAGALSVGIGFGLQSIVNNFVSGLILLAERRVSIGDWIVVGNEEGHVRRISVRATEIETFDRNFVIIPNADLMSNPVKNWTFQHRRARVIIEVGVGYDSDPKQVQEIMKACANEHPMTIDAQRTRVTFEAFGDSALIFRLRTYVGDVSNKLTVLSDLNIAVLEAFRAAGIDIPFPQTDVHLKGVESKVKSPSSKIAVKRISPAAKAKKAAAKSLS